MVCLLETRGQVEKPRVPEVNTAARHCYVKVHGKKMDYFGYVNIIYLYYVRTHSSYSYIAIIVQDQVTSTNHTQVLPTDICKYLLTVPQS